MSTPAISVLMPVFNAQRYLREAVLSILDQSEKDFEFIIIDDGSTDDSLNILRGFEHGDPRIRIISRGNTGYCVALNEGLALARGALVARMDADDVAAPTRFELQLKFMAEHPEVLAVGGSAELIDGEGRLLLRSHQPTSDREIQEGALRGRTLIVHSTAMIRRQALLDAGGYDPDLCPSEDLDLWLRLGERGKLANLPDFLGKYRLHTDSVCATITDKQKANSRRASESARKRRGSSIDYDWSEPSRPSQESGSQHDFMLKYGWWAFQSAQRRTAMIYGWRAVRRQPWRSSGWRLLLCAAIKPMVVSSNSSLAPCK